MSGKSGRWVFQNSRHGQICYEHFIPANPNTLAQQRVRGNFREVGKRWAPLGEWKRELWIAEAATRKTRKRHGQCWPMTGWNYFHQVNVWRVNRGLPPLDLPPEYLQRLEARLAAAIACANAAKPLLGPALFLQASRVLVNGNEASAGFPAGRPPPRLAAEPSPGLAR